ncbi:MAG: DNA topoisomerase, partial [bacterium]
VQSPALRMIVERELEIEAFKPREYWTIEADNEKDGQKFQSKLTHYAGEKLSQFTVNNGDQAAEIEKTLLKAASGELTVSKVTRKQRKRNPAAPFTTSTLQQEAARKLGFTTNRTMRVAQQLYEGIDTGDGASGLITYMRTDSVNLADEALAEVRQYISDKYGADDVPATPRVFKTKSKNAQEAHEAIRPTTFNKPPKEIASYLSKDQLRLYELIWKRTLACQMIHATIDTVAADLAAGDVSNLFRANGSTIAKPGFIQVYM